MGRTTTEAVLARCPTDMTDISFALQAAGLLVDQVYGATVQDQMSELIERELACHFIAVADPRATESTFDGIRQKFEVGTAGEGILSTQFGRSANALSGGKLAQAMTQEIVFRVY